jgi:hypothetical protein
MQLSWHKCKGDVWCTFAAVNVGHPAVGVDGVYIIWKGSQVVYVGQGDISERIQAHRGEPQITRFDPGLLVTWAEVPQEQRSGVENFLANSLDPAVGARRPLGPPIAVNSPW